MFLVVQHSGKVVLRPCDGLEGLFPNTQVLGTTRTMASEKGHLAFVERMPQDNWTEKCNSYGDVENSVSY